LGAGPQQPAAHAELDVVSTFGVGIMQPPSGFAGVDLQQGFEGQAGYHPRPLLRK
jgi:hypothetical protein